MLLLGLGPQPVEELVSRMSEPEPAAGAGADVGSESTQAAAAALQQLIKTEGQASEPTGPPPSLIPLAGRDAIAQAEKQQVKHLFKSTIFNRKKG